jgi:hypothetical protein
MNKVFCVSCGFKILYEIAKPKFCSSCGSSIGASLSSAPKEEEEEEVANLDVNIDKLKKDIVVEGSNESTSLKDLWSSVTPSEAQGGGAGRDLGSRPPSKDPEGQALLDKLRKDCGSSRQRDIDE